MPENKHLKFLLTVAYLALGGAALWLALHFLLPWTLPFLLALLLAALLERPVTFFMDRLRLPRWAAAALCTVLLLLAVGAVLFLCVWRLWYEGSLLLGRLPSLLSALPSLGAPLERWPIASSSPPRPKCRNRCGRRWRPWRRRAPRCPTGSTAPCPPGRYPHLRPCRIGDFFFSPPVLPPILPPPDGPRSSLFFADRRLPPGRPALRTGCRRFRATAGGWLKAQAC